MLISTIIPTVGRSTLSRAVYSVLNQDFQTEACEVIVVNDSGKELSSEDWQSYANVRVISTNRLNRSIARNTGAAIANGKYLHFLDDDDWMLPGAFKAFRETAKNSSARWIHGAFRLVDNDGDKIADIFPEEKGNCFLNLISWEWLPLQASIVEAEAFFNVGGFATLESLKGGFEDIHLTRQIALYYEFMNMSKLVAVIRSGENGSTTNYRDMFIQNWQSREKSIEVPGSHERLISSAQNNKDGQAYWYGKIVYYFLGSALRNFKANRFSSAGRRAFQALMSLLVARRFLFQGHFWHGVTKPHYSRVWRAIEKSGKELYPSTRWSKGT